MTRAKGTDTDAQERALTVIRKSFDALNTDGKALNGATVLLLGVTYKPNIADQREAPVLPLSLLFSWICGLSVEPVKL